MRIRCRLSFHNWSLWSDPEPESRTQRTTNRQTGEIVSTWEFCVLVQRRRCQDCRRTEIREVRS